MSEEVINDEAIVAGSGTAEGGAPDPTEVAVPDGEAAPAPSPEPVQSTYRYGEQEVEVEVPDDLRAVLTEKELDADALVKELYSSKDFSLTRETKDKLDAAFGKFFVDQYLNSLKVQNDKYIGDYKSQQEASKAAAAEAEAWGTEAVGGDWDAFESKALAVMSDSQIEQFNAAMQSGNKMVQEYAIKAALELAGSAATPEIELGGNSPAESESGAITRQQYTELMIQAKNENIGNPAGYRAAIAALDARREAGIARGI